MVAFIIISRIVLNLPCVGPRQARAIGSPAKSRSSVCPHRLPLGGWQRLRDSDGGKIDWGACTRERTAFVRGGLLPKRNIKGSF